MRVVYGHDTAGRGELSRTVCANGVPLRETEFAFRKSQGGYNWGYLGSGPSALAHDLLAHATGDRAVALEHYQAFKRDHVATWNDGWRITRGAILRWLQFRRRGIEPPQVWWDGPPDPPDAIRDWLEDCEFETYRLVAVLAGEPDRNFLGDLLEDAGLDRVLAPGIHSRIPTSWREAVGG